MEKTGCDVTRIGGAEIVIAKDCFKVVPDKISEVSKEGAIVLCYDKNLKDYAVKIGEHLRCLKRRIFLCELSKSGETSDALPDFIRYVIGVGCGFACQKAHALAKGLGVPWSLFLTAPTTDTILQDKSPKHVFIDENDPIYNGNNTDGSGGNEVIDNIFTNCSGNTKGQGTSFTPPYDYSFALPANQVEAAVKANAGATLASPTACDESTPASSSSVTPASSSSVEKLAEKAYQAEKGSINGGVVENSNDGFNGEGYVNFNKGGDFTIPVKVDVAGQYKLNIDFSNGSGEERALAISAGESKAEHGFKATISWTTWVTESVNLDLVAGENTVKFATVGGNDGPNIDQFDVTLVKAADTTGQGSTLGVAMKSSALVLQGVYSMSVYATDGRFIRKVDNVSQAMLRDTRGLTAGLPAGVYLVRVTAPGVSRSYFTAVK